MGWDVGGEGEPSLVPTAAFLVQKGPGKAESPTLFAKGSQGFSERRLEETVRPRDQKQTPHSKKLKGLYNWPVEKVLGRFLHS